MCDFSVCKNCHKIHQENKSVYYSNLVIQAFMVCLGTTNGSFYFSPEFISVFQYCEIVRVVL